MEAETIILKNIRLYRKMKEIKSESMAKALGISQSEYSKLENGRKRSWTVYLPEIARILGVTFYELVHLNLVFESQPDVYRPLSSQTLPTGKPYPDIELYERIIYELKEKDRLKDELLQSIIQSRQLTLNEPVKFQERIF